MPQPPQLPGSLETSTQAPPQSNSGQAQVEPELPELELLEPELPDVPVPVEDIEEEVAPLADEEWVPLDALAPELALPVELVPLEALAEALEPVELEALDDAPLLGPREVAEVLEDCPSDRGRKQAVAPRARARQASQVRRFTAPPRSAKGPARGRRGPSGRRPPAPPGSGAGPSRG